MDTFVEHLLVVMATPKLTRNDRLTCSTHKTSHLHYKSVHIITQYSTIVIVIIIIMLPIYRICTTLTPVTVVLIIRKMVVVQEI